MTDDLSLLIDAARASGDIARRHFNSAPEVWDKPGGAGPVTEADLAVNDMLSSELRAARPDYGWLSEESEDTDARLATDHQFIIDPIDGTRSFIDGKKDWSHSLAISRGGIITAAAVYVPMRDALFAAALGKGATLNGAPLTVAAQKPMDESTILASKPNLNPKFWEGDVPPPFQRTFRSSLAYRLCLVAQGQFDGMITLRPTWEWDVAAGALIVSEARGTASDSKGDTPVFNNPHPQIHGMVAAGGIHQSLIFALKR